MGMGRAGIVEWPGVAGGWDTTSSSVFRGFERGGRQEGSCYIPAYLGYSAGQWVCRWPWSAGRCEELGFKRWAFMLQLEEWTLILQVKTDEAQEWLPRPADHHITSPSAHQISLQRPARLLHSFASALRPPPTHPELGRGLKWKASFMWCEEPFTLLAWWKQMGSSTAAVFWDPRGGAARALEFAV